MLREKRDLAAYLQARSRDKQVRPLLREPGESGIVLRSISPSLEVHRELLSNDRMIVKNFRLRKANSFLTYQSSMFLTIISTHHADQNNNRVAISFCSFKAVILDDLTITVNYARYIDKRELNRVLVSRKKRRHKARTSYKKKVTTQEIGFVRANLQL